MLSHSNENRQTDRNYYYIRDWFDRLINSNSFYFPNGHENPDSFPLESKTHTADAVYIGQYELGTEVKDKFEKYTELTSDTRPDDINIKLHYGYYYHTQDVFHPQVGDIRVHFTVAGMEGSTVNAMKSLMFYK